MATDINQLFTERDIEDFFYDHPELLGIERWIARQYVLPSGIADLIGLTSPGIYGQSRVAVVEIKNVPINKAAILQVCRYEADVRAIVDHKEFYPRDGAGYSHVEKIVVGTTIDDQTALEASACNVEVYFFKLEIQIDVERMGDMWKESWDQLVKLSLQPIWDIFAGDLLDVAEDEQDSQSAEMGIEELDGKGEAYSG